MALMPKNSTATMDADFATRRSGRHRKPPRTAGIAGMGLILDSSVVIAAERGGQVAYQMLEDIGLQSNDSEIAVSVVTVLELAHGITRADTAQRRARRRQFLDDLLVGMPVHSRDGADRSYSLDRSTDRRRRRVDGIALADLLIGVTRPRT